MENSTRSESGVISTTEEELQKMFPIGDLFRRTVLAISQWPDFSFRTPDDRVYLCFDNRRSIRSRLESIEGAIRRDEAEALEQCEAIIAERDSEDQPLVFYDLDEAADFWLRLHRSHGEPLSSEEMEWFGCTNEKLFGTDED